MELGPVVFGLSSGTVQGPSDRSLGHGGVGYLCFLGSLFASQKSSEPFIRILCLAVIVQVSPGFGQSA